jgi:polygalacturonase
MGDGVDATPGARWTPSRRAFLRGSVVAVAAPLLLTRPALGSAPQTRFSVRVHGAKGDGKVNDTRAIQAAIDGAGRAGGTVYFPPGDYVSGTLRLRSRVTVELGAGATLIASRDDGDFDPVEEPVHDSFSDAETRDFRFALLQGRGLTGVGILGPGRIDGNRASRRGPKPIALRECRDVRLRDLTILNAGNYNVSLLGCNGVDIRGVTVRNGYSDGITPDCCENVRITDCRIDSRDDAIVLKASFVLGTRRATRNVTVYNCHVTTFHNGLKLGTESTGDFRDIVFRNCTVVGRPHPWKGELTSGVAITTVDGGRLERVAVQDIRMTNVRAPLFIRLGQRGRGQDVPVAGTLRGVSISNVVATGATVASSITGIPDRTVSEISIKNVRITARGGGTADIVEQRVPELERTYPDAYMFRDLPAYGLYVRHVDGLELVDVNLAVDQPDARPALVLDDVRRARVNALQATPATPADQPLVWLRSVRDGRLENLRPRSGTRIVVRLSGPDTTGIRLARSDFKHVERVAAVDAEVAASALSMPGNVMPTELPGG